MNNNQPLSYDYLRRLHDELRAKYLIDVKNDIECSSTKAALLRSRRAISWIRYAEQELNRREVAFVFLWISFNALYGQNAPDDEEQARQRDVINQFLETMVVLDTESRIHEILEFLDLDIDRFLSNWFVFKGFWTKYKDRMPFDYDTFSARTWRYQSTKEILKTVFERIYVLRNQVFHGSTTSVQSGTTGRRQLVEGFNIVQHLVPLFTYLTMVHDEHGWALPEFPGNPLKYANGSWKEEIQGIGWREV